VRAGEAEAIAAAPPGLPPPPTWEGVVHGRWGEHTVLPWQHLKGPLERTTLWQHRNGAGMAAPIGASNGEHLGGPPGAAPEEG